MLLFEVFEATCVKLASKALFEGFKASKNLETQGFSGMWDYSHSIVPTGLGVRSRRTLLIPSTSAVMRFVIL